MNGYIRHAPELDKLWRMLENLGWMNVGFVNRHYLVIGFYIQIFCEYFGSNHSVLPVQVFTI